MSDAPMSEKARAKGDRHYDDVACWLVEQADSGKKPRLTVKEARTAGYAMICLKDAEADEKKVLAIAASLTDQTDEPEWTTGNYAERMNYWRDKAIGAAKELRTLLNGDAA